MKTLITTLSLLLALNITLAVSISEDDLAELIHDLKNPDAENRAYALHSLSEMGLDAAPALSQITQALDDKNDRVRAAAADALSSIGKDAAPAIPRLIVHLGEGELPRIDTDVGGFSEVGQSCAGALGQIGKDALPPLMKCLVHENPLVRLNAVCALGELGPDAKSAGEALLKLLNDENDQVISFTIWALDKIDPSDKKTINAVLKKLNDKSRLVRQSSVEFLGKIRPCDPVIIQALIKMLNDKEGVVQARAAEALGGLGGDALAAVPTLSEMLKSSKGYPYGLPSLWEPVAKPVARALSKIGPKAKAAMPELINTIRNRKGTYKDIFDLVESNKEVRAEAIIAAAKIDPNNEELLKVLTESLKEDVYIQDKVAIALAAIGPKAKDNLPMLVDLMNQENDKGEILTFACAILHIEPSNAQAREKILSALKEHPPDDEDEWTFVLSALKLANIDNRYIVPCLEQILKDRSSNLDYLFRILGQIGPEAKETVPALVDLLETASDDYRQGIINALQRITSGESLILITALKERYIQCSIIEVLGSSSNNVPLLTETLHSASARVRLAAIKSLEKMSPKAISAIPEIQKMLDDKSLTICEEAKQAIEKIKQ
jgi:HEAT repeat protein